jgi:hypothetical protein
MISLVRKFYETLIIIFFLLVLYYFFLNFFTAKIDIEVTNANDINKVSQKNVQSSTNRKELKNISLSSKILFECDNNFCQTNNELKLEIFSERNINSIEKSKIISIGQERLQKQPKSWETYLLDTKKVSAVKLDKLPNVEIKSEVRDEKLNKKKMMLIQECWEEFQENNLQNDLRITVKQNQSMKEIMKKQKESINLPEELMSNLKFKDIFKPDGWESLGNDIELPNDLSDDKYHPILDKLSSGGIEQNSSNSSWSEWGNWGMNTLFNTATVGVSALSNHVTQGLFLLEETMGVSDLINLTKADNSLQQKLKSNGI